MDTTGKPTKAQLAALKGIAECARSDGWATMWPATVSRKSIRACATAGWLEESTKPEGRLPFLAYRLTDKGRAVMGKRVSA